MSQPSLTSLNPTFSTQLYFFNSTYLLRSASLYSNCTHVCTILTPYTPPLPDYY